MGGLAFAQPGNDGLALHTPRMTPTEYDILKAKCLDILSLFYHRVACPAEAPAKTDYGDIDIFASSPRLSDIDPGCIAERLSARRYLVHGSTCSYAVPLPDRKDDYAQIDVQVCPGSYLSWELFMHSYGDLWQILAAVHMDAGLKANNKGLHVLLPETTSVNKKTSMLCLTHDPVAVMEFLGLDVTKHEKGFNNDEEIFKWCTSGRYPSIRSTGRGAHDSNERRRMETRKMYAQFVADWIPAHPEIAKHQWTREDVLEEAVRWFGREEAYESMVNEAKLEKTEEELWHRIATVIPLEGDKLNLVIRGLKRWVRLDEGRAILREEPDMYNDLRPLWALQMAKKDEPALLEWIRNHWEEVKTKEKKRMSEAKAARKVQ